MNDQTNAPPFPPFMPPAASPPVQPGDNKPETDKQKTAREKREAKAAAKAAKPEAPRRRSSPATKTSAKFDLQTILAAASTLNTDDYPLFEQLINQLDEAGKPARERLLTAIGKIFL